MKHLLLVSLIVLSCVALHECMDPVCDEPPGVRGPCRAYMPRYTYNPETGKCGRFIYGGCGGNGNNFVSFQLCHKTCH